MRTGGSVLVVDGPEALDRVLQRPPVFSALRLPPGSPAAELEGRLNAAYLACGCELARVSALTGLLLATGLAVIAWPGDAGWTVWRSAATGLAGLAGFGVFGLAGERLALHRARRRLIALVAELSSRLGGPDSAKVRSDPSGKPPAGQPV